MPTIYDLTAKEFRIPATLISEELPVTVVASPRRVSFIIPGHIITVEIENQESPTIELIHARK